MLCDLVLSLLIVAAAIVGRLGTAPLGAVGLATLVILLKMLIQKHYLELVGILSLLRPTESF